MKNENALSEFVHALDLQNNVLGKARNAFLLKESERKHFEATLVREAEGKSHAERTINAQANPSWLLFQQELARLEAVYEFQKLRFEILDKEWQSQYLTCKLDGAVIRKQGA